MNFSSAATVEVLRRVFSSPLLPSTSSPSSYQEQTTPSHEPEPKPREQAVIRVRDKRWAGLYVHNYVMGFVSTVLPLTVYPFLMGFLNMEGTQTLSARSLLALPWILRPVFRSLIDSLTDPESCRHRRYVRLGWLVASVVLTVSTFIHINDPYFPKRIRPAAQDQLSSAELSLVNVEAPAKGAIFVMLSSITMVGLVLADVGADALIEQTANEYFPPLVDGADSPFVYDISVKRVAGMLTAFVFMGITMNGEEYGGDFNFTLGYDHLMAFVSLVMMIPGPCAKFFITEHTPESTTVSSYVQAMRNVLENRGLILVIMYGFITGILRGVTATPGSPIAMYWANVQPINDNIISFVASLAVIGAMRIAGKKDCVPNEVRALVIASVAVLVLDCSLTMATIWDVVRSKYVWIGMPLLQALPSALEFVAINAVLDDIIEPNTAQPTRELIVAVSILSSSLGAVVTKLIDAVFNVSNDDILRDSHDVRSNATTVFIIAYSAQLLSLACILVLSHRGDVFREWKIRQNTPSLGQRLLFIGALTIGLLLSLTVHIMSLIESTSCHRIAGGNGCD